jgi:hypothetical protein
VTAGVVVRDDTGELTAARASLAWYPLEVWRYLLAAGWARIAQEEAFVGRSGSRGDDIGSRVIAARLVHDVMRLAFLLERRYAPYPKWLGTAFASLTSAAALLPPLDAALRADSWHEREAQLGVAYERAAAIHNSLGITAPADTALRRYHERPFTVLGADRFVAACRAAIEDPELRAIDSDVGAVDQLADATELLSRPELARELAGLYRVDRRG